MKFLLVVALACMASAATVQRNPKLEEIRQRLGKDIIQALLPALPAELALDPVDISIDTSLVAGRVTLDNGVVRGLDTVTDGLQLNLLTLTVSGPVNVATVQLTGDATADAQLNLLTGSYALKGAGPIDITITGISVPDFRARVLVNLITNRVSISQLSLTPSISGASGQGEGFTANGEPVDWAAVGAEAPGAVSEYWAANGAGLTEEIRGIVNDLIKDLTLQELIDLITGGGSN